MRKFGWISRLLAMFAASFVTCMPSLFAIDEARLLERYVLIGIISGDGSAKTAGIAVVRDKQFNKSLMLRKGDRLPSADDWQVASIAKRGVTLSREGREVLLLQGTSEEEKKTKFVSVTPETDKTYKPLNPFRTDKAVITENVEPKPLKRVEAQNDGVEIRRPVSTFDYKTEADSDDDELFFGPENGDFEDNINAENNANSEDEDALVILPLVGPSEENEKSKHANASELSDDE